MTKSSLGFLFIGFLFCSLFIGGCAKKITNIELAPDFERKYQELKTKGATAIKKRPDFEETRESIISVYQMELFKNYVSDCQVLSMGLQFILIEQTSHELGESLLAVSADSPREFSEMLFWHQNSVNNAIEFLKIARATPGFRQIIAKRDSRALEYFFEIKGYDVCDTEATLDVLIEYEGYFPL